MVCFQSNVAGGGTDTEERTDPNIFETLARMGKQTISSRDSEISDLTNSVQSLTATIGHMKRDLESLMKGDNAQSEQSPVKRY